MGLNLASIYPLPTGPGSFNNYVSTADQVIDDNGGNARVDYHLSDKDSMFGRFSYEKFVQTAPNPSRAAKAPAAFPRLRLQPSSSTSDPTWRAFSSPR